MHVYYNASCLGLLQVADASSSHNMIVALLSPRRLSRVCHCMTDGLFRMMRITSDPIQQSSPAWGPLHYHNLIFTRIARNCSFEMICITFYDRSLLIWYVKSLSSLCLSVVHSKAFLLSGSLGPTTSVMVPLICPTYSCIPWHRGPESSFFPFHHLRCHH